MKNRYGLLHCCFILFLLHGCIESNDGRNIYETNCSNCHGKNGEGLRKLIPPLNGSDFFQSHQRQLACIIRYGLMDTILVNGVQFHQQMPGNKKLNIVDITNLINYINKQWYNEIKPVTTEQVKENLKDCEK